MQQLVVSASSDDSIWTSMFAFQVSPAEKVIRTVLVYLVIAVLIRFFGRRTLAQLNMTDLVVVLLLSNVVQNAIIGDDNSISGGVLGAVVLMVTDQVIDRLCYSVPWVSRIFEGSSVRLVSDGQIDRKAMDRVGLRDHELHSVLHRQGADNVGQVRRVDLQPGGNFDLEVMQEYQDATIHDLARAVDRLQVHLDKRLAAIEAKVGGG